MRVVGVIPAREGSSRLPRKPLMDICGRPMVWWVYRQAKKAEGLEEIVVATDSREIYEECEKLEIPAVMTSDRHPTAIHRLYEVSQKLTADFYLQINGDEPLIDHRVIEAVIPASGMWHQGAWGRNAITRMMNPVEVMDATNIKMVFNEQNICTYMSRTPIPFPYKAIDWDYYKHVGIIGYSPEMLEFYVQQKPGRLERIEGIDLLRFIDYGKELSLVEVKGMDSLSVDTEKDLHEVRKRVEKRLETSSDSFLTK